MPLPAPWSGAVEELPGGPAADPARVRRGVGYALGFKNIAFSEGFDDPSTASVRVELDGGRTRASVHCAAAEVGQGFVTIAEQIVRTELGVDEVMMLARRHVDRAGRVDQRLPADLGVWRGSPAGLHGRRPAGRGAGIRRRQASPPRPACSPAEWLWARGCAYRSLRCLPTGPITAERTFRHRKTSALDARGQGDAHVAWSFVVHRAVVDVDLDLGTVRVVELATVQDVGKALNPLSVLGQLEGGTAQGVGFALTEELALEGGFVIQPTFSEYLIPNAVDLPMLQVELVEEPEPDAPFGAKGVGEAPTVSSPAAVMAAMRAATGLAL